MRAQNALSDLGCCAGCMAAAAKLRKSKVARLSYTSKSSNLLVDLLARIKSLSTGYSASITLVSTRFQRVFEFLRVALKILKIPYG